MQVIFSALLCTSLMVGGFTTVNALRCSGPVTDLTLKEDEITDNLDVSWAVPSGVSGCTYTVTYASNAPHTVTKTFETENLQYTIDKKFLVPCSTAAVAVSTSDGKPSTEKIDIAAKASTAPVLLDITWGQIIEMIWEGQPYTENMCEHTHFQFTCLSSHHNFTIPRYIFDQEDRMVYLSLEDALTPDNIYTCNGYMFVTLAGLSPASEDIQIWIDSDNIGTKEKNIPSKGVKGRQMDASGVHINIPL